MTRRALYNGNKMVEVLQRNAHFAIVRYNNKVLPIDILDLYFVGDF